MMSTVSSQVAVSIENPELSFVVLFEGLDYGVWLVLGIMPNPELAVLFKALHSLVFSKHESISLCLGN